MDTNKTTLNYCVAVVAIICVTWIVCSMINSRPGRYCAVPKDHIILDKTLAALQRMSNELIIMMSSFDPYFQSRHKSVLRLGYWTVSDLQTR